MGAGPGAAVVVMARRDLAKMKAGLMDPAGERLVTSARRRGTWGIVLGLPVCVLCVGLPVAVNILANRF